MNDLLQVPRDTITSLAQWAEDSRMVGRERWEELHRVHSAEGLSTSISLPTSFAQPANLGVHIDQVIAITPHAEGGKGIGAARCRRAPGLDAHQPCPRLTAIGDGHRFASIQA